MKTTRPDDPVPSGWYNYMKKRNYFTTQQTLSNALTRTNCYHYYFWRATEEDGKDSREGHGTGWASTQGTGGVSAVRSFGGADPQTWMSCSAGSWQVGKGCLAQQSGRSRHEFGNTQLCPVRGGIYFPLLKRGWLWLSLTNSSVKWKWGSSGQEVWLPSTWEPRIRGQCSQLEGKAPGVGRCHSRWPAGLSWEGGSRAWKATRSHLIIPFCLAGKSLCYPLPQFSNR